MPADAIDARVRAGEPLYDIDRSQLKRLRPDVVITQQQCTVCAVGEADVRRALDDHHPAVIVSLSASRLEALVDDVHLVANTIGRGARAEQLLNDWRARLNAVRARTAGNTLPRVLALSWYRPLMTVGHWVTNMIAVAGGLDVAPVRASRRIDADDALACNPDIVLLMPCGLSQTRAAQEWRNQRVFVPGSRRDAIQTHRVFVVDGSLFHRPGPRLIDGIELLADLFHPLPGRSPDPATFAVVS